MNNRDDEQPGFTESARLTEEEERIWKLEGFDQIPPFLSVTAAAQLLGISRSSGYARVEDGTIESIRIRRRLVVPRHALFNLVVGLQHAHPSS